MKQFLKHWLTSSEERALWVLLSIAVMGLLAQWVPANKAPLKVSLQTVVLDINTASKAQWETLPGVGPKTAECILQFRAQQPFASIEDLAQVPGVGEKTLERLRPFLKAS